MSNTGRQPKNHSRLSRREHVLAHIGARNMEHITAAVVSVIFAFCFAHLEYYYIKDPALQISNGKVHANYPMYDRSRETKPIIGNMYEYHLFPMLFIFFLISFAALWDDITFRLFGRHSRIKAALIGFANLVTAITVEDFAWFLNRWIAPLQDDPKGGQLMQSTDWTSMHLGAINAGSFVIPVWYLIAIAIAAAAYYGGFRKAERSREDESEGKEKTGRTTAAS